MNRISRLKSLMAARGIDALVTFKPEHSFYLSGFNPIIFSHPVIAILPAEGEPVILVHALRDDHGRSESWVKDIRLYGAWSTKVTMGPNWQDALRAILAEKGLDASVLGVEEDYLPVTRHRLLTELLPKAKLVDSSAVFDRARLVKDADEIANVRVAAALADIGMDAAQDALAQGGSEREIATSSMAAMNGHWALHLPDHEVADFGSLEGGAQNGLWTWALAGDRMFRNCDNPTQRKPQRGEAVAVFIWAIANGVHAENERTFAYGPLPDANRRAIDTILKIREDIAPAMRPGAPLAELFHITKRGLEDAGYAANIPGRIGHTIGLGAHEHTSLDGKTDVILEPGMLFTLEPNLRVPDRGVATQISDTILITETGHEFLTQSRGGYIEV
ncbi:M24 family metallopeptidase [Falsirhodobacter sp. 1013]|uniref:M24 family metallopeptidase n=1 Tax=Falsirhodobacter sp. 1013 TaxID=3417566 RepID=UPI003EBCB584